jgi:hypothetical protein
MVLTAKEIRDILKTLPKTRKALIAKTEKLVKSAEKNERRGSRTRGWAVSAPQRGKERKELLMTCGEKCFLMPNEKKFPVCAATRVSKECKYDCRGIISAKIRAKQYKYPEVAALAEKLEKMYC